MKIPRKKLALGALLVALGITVIMISVSKSAKASRQYRVSLYANGNTPARTWVTDDLQQHRHSSVLEFESMGKKIIVNGNVVVEEQ